MGQVSGRVLDFDTKKPLEQVLIINKSGNEWTVSNEIGAFSLDLKASNFILEFQLLGKQDFIIESKNIENSDNLQIYLKDDDLRLDKVMVTAVPKKSKIGSTVTLGEYAINQVQAYSLADILKQLPGQEVTPPSLNRPNSISLRTANPNDNNAFGVSYMLDGMQLSNDENMQSYSPGFDLTAYDNTNTGIDLRTIPASNIEEVEVISGIPDAKYGNLTSGVIDIKRKAGISPYHINANIRQGNTSLSLQKGYGLGKQLGNLSVSLDYLNANADPRNSLESYNRVTALLIWSLTNKNKTLRNSFSLTAHNNLDDEKFDKDNDDGGRDSAFRKDRGIRFNNRLNWKPAVSLIDNINLNTGFSYAYQHSYRQEFRNDGGRIVPLNLETGISKGTYTPVAYLMKRETFGQPLNISANISGDKAFNAGNTSHSLTFGFDFSYSDNKGRGKEYDPEHAHTQVSFSGGSSGLEEGIRQVNFKRSVLGQFRFGAHLQDNITHTFSNNRKVFANLGFRYDSQNGFSSYSPRVNLAYELTNRLSVRGGFGFASKAPSLAQTFPGDKYFDRVLADYRTSNYSYNLIYTHKVPIEKNELEPSKSWKYELGGNFNAAFAQISFSAFYNESFDGFTSDNIIQSVYLPQLEFSFPNSETPPTYEIVGPATMILNYSLPTNASTVIDKGIEFFINFKKIEAINTSFNVNGTYTYSNSASILPTIRKNPDPLNEEYLYGIYNRTSNKQDMWRLRGTITHHISAIGLLMSFTAEHFIRSAVYASFADIYPIGYIDASANQYSIPSSERTNPEYASLFLDPDSTEDRITPFYNNFHFRLTKEMRNNISISLYANNFLNYRPTIEVNDAIRRKNEAISFGANLKYEF